MIINNIGADNILIKNPAIEAAVISARLMIEFAIEFDSTNLSFLKIYIKGTLDSMQLRLMEQAKIHCAREHFQAISKGDVVYDVVDSCASLLEKVMK